MEMEMEKKEEMENMELRKLEIYEITKVKEIRKRFPILKLKMGSSYSDDFDFKNIYLSDVKRARIGKIWKTREVHIIRDSIEQEAKVIYKDSNGAFILVISHIWDDSGDGEMEVKTNIIYVSF
ncbi:MAG: hypothetical protein QXV17_11630 [Candidatus Micrarchaeaceae archaeon]